LLAAVAVLFCGLVLDVWMKKEDMFTGFGGQFFDGARTDEFAQANRDAIAETEGRLDFEREGIQEVYLSNMRGNVDVARATDDTIRLRYTATAAGSDADAARLRTESVRMTSGVEGSRLSFAAEAGGKAVDADRVRIDYELLLPDGMNVRIDSEEGGVQIRGTTGDATVASYDGITDIVGVVGNVSVAMTYGHAYVANVAGSVTMSNEFGAATLEQAQGPVTLNSLSGDASIERVEGNVIFSAHQGELRLHDVAGRVEAKSTESVLRLGDIRGDLSLAAESGEVRLALAESEGYTLDVSVREGELLAQLPPAIERADEPNVVRLRGVVGTGKRNVEADAFATDVIIHSK
jgi:DUF4097 and DUF4098 domain-containing protein YvlB